MNSVVFGSALVLVGGISTVFTGSVPAHGMLAELVWVVLAVAGIITVAGIEASS